MKSQINKEQWMALFKEIGLDEATMLRWHQLFETRHSDAHQKFLEWLGIGAEEIKAIRHRVS